MRKKIEEFQQEIRDKVGLCLDGANFFVELYEQHKEDDVSSAVAYLHKARKDLLESSRLARLMKKREEYQLLSSKDKNILENIIQNGENCEL
jgi:hypothetical protein